MVKVCAVTSVHEAFDVRIFHKQCRSLVKAGFDVALIAPHSRHEIVDGVNIVAIPRVTRRVKRAAFSTFEALRQAIRVNAEIYHLHDPELIPAGLVLKARGKLVVFDAHEDYPKAMLSKHYLPKVTRPGVSWSVGWMARLARRCFTAVISATPSIAETLGGTSGRHIVVQNFPDLTEFASPSQTEQAWDQRELSVAYVGSISEIRGIVEILDAFARIPERLPVRLALAGSFAPQALRCRLERHAAWRRVDWLSQLPRSKVATLLRRVRAGLVLFKDEPNHVTAYPTKMFEYMSAGIPLIASDFPLWRQIVNDARCGVVVDPTDSRAIARAIEYVVTNEADACRMGRAGLDAATQTYNWASEEAKLVTLYRELAAGRRQVLA
jgi:glycosyltransferase involved in cell wall biosynthesis